ncbi:MAG: hypothetical protein WGN25_04975 [Candidatus Electrothrix sp. GW3-4]|uniref:hypothetical protein n=1 Tax=Candidatus Electrothrix sp. GW3-4 TaxID=3126740 RepID=UPI0030CF98FD
MKKRQKEHEISTTNNANNVGIRSYYFAAELARTCEISSSRRYNKRLLQSQWQHGKGDTKRSRPKDASEREGKKI